MQLTKATIPAQSVLWNSSMLVLLRLMQRLMLHKQAGPLHVTCAVVDFHANTMWWFTQCCIQMQNRTSVQFVRAVFRAKATLKSISAHTLVMTDVPAKHAIKNSKIQQTSWHTWSFTLKEIGSNVVTVTRRWRMVQNFANIRGSTVLRSSLAVRQESNWGIWTVLERNLISVLTVATQHQCDVGGVDTGIDVWRKWKKWR